METILVTGISSSFVVWWSSGICRIREHVAGKNAPAADELRALARRERLWLHVVDMDITDNASVEQAIESIMGMTGGLDVVVNNAGTAYVGPLEALTLDQARKQYDTNVFGISASTGRFCHTCATGVCGPLVRIVSIAARVVVPFLGLYTGTKFALDGSASPTPFCQWSCKEGLVRRMLKDSVYEHNFFWTPHA